MKAGGDVQKDKRNAANKLETGTNASNVPGGNISGITLRLSRPMGEWPPSTYPSEVWPIAPFGLFTRLPQGTLVPLDEHPGFIARGKSFGFLPRPLATRNTVRGVPRVPSTGSRAVVAKG